LTNIWSGHTQTPWRADTFLVTGADGAQVAHTGGSGRSPEEQIANAAFTAHATSCFFELLGALMDVEENARTDGVEMWERVDRAITHALRHDANARSQRDTARSACGVMHTERSTYLHLDGVTLLEIPRHHVQTPEQVTECFTRAQWLARLINEALARGDRP
jgi:hypothetical protein